MAKKGGYSGLGTLLELGTGTTVSGVTTYTYAALGEVVSVEGPDPVLGMRDTTVLSSTSKGKRPTLPDLGKCKFMIHYDPDDAVHFLLQGKVITPPPVPDSFKLVFPTGDTTPPNEVFEGYVVSFKKKGMTEKDTIEADVEIDITDLFTPTAGTP